MNSLGHIQFSPKMEHDNSLRFGYRTFIWISFSPPPLQKIKFCHSVVCQVCIQFLFECMFDIPDLWITDLLQLKDPVSLDLSQVNYHIQCECGLENIGYIHCALGSKIYKHQYCISKKLLQICAVSNTVKDALHHFNFQSARIIFHTSNTGELDFVDDYCVHRGIDGLENSLLSPSLSCLDDVHSLVVTFCNSIGLVHT